jgi:multimeric flavodoxin WrbA
MGFEKNITASSCLNWLVSPYLDFRRFLQMKTLIWNGSPHPRGSTAYLITELTELLEGELKVVDTYRSNIAPCIDCYYCRKHVGCSQKDEMQDVYAYLIDCDNVVIASPVYFSELTGPLLSVASRLEMLYCSSRFLGHEIISKKKKGAIILCGGGDGEADCAKKTAVTLLSNMRAVCVAQIGSFHTDSVPAWEDASVKQEVRFLAQQLNESRN